MLHNIGARTLNLGSRAKNLIYTIKLIFMGIGMVWSQFCVQLWHAESESGVLTVLGSLW